MVDTKFKVGDIVKITSKGGAYTSYSYMFRKMGFRDKDRNSLPRTTGTLIGQVFAVDLHQVSHLELVAIVLEGGVEVLMSADAIEKVSFERKPSLPDPCDKTPLPGSRTPLSYEGDIRDFPPEVVELMLQRQFEQTGKRDISVFECKRSYTARQGGFDWDKTPESEGCIFWHRVISRREFNLFFTKYPKKMEKQQQITVTVSVDFVKQAHKEACKEWKEKIETEFPTLFEKRYKAGSIIEFAGANYLLTNIGTKAYLIKIQNGSPWNGYTMDYSNSYVTEKQLTNYIGTQSWVCHVYV